MEMNQTLQAVSVVLKDVLLLVRIAINLLAFVAMSHHAVNKMVLQPTVLPVSVDLQNVLQLVRIAINLLIFVVLYHRAVKKMVVQPTMLPVSVELQNVLLVPGFSVTKQTMAQAVVIKLPFQRLIQKLKVVRAVRYREE